MLKKPAEDFSSQISLKKLSILIVFVVVVVVVVFPAGELYSAVVMAVLKKLLQGKISLQSTVSGAMPETLLSILREIQLLEYPIPPRPALPRPRHKNRQVPISRKPRVVKTKKEEV